MQIAVLGGGAAGFFAAITAAERNRGAHVRILEAHAAPLAKVRISGGGRCNVTHHCFDVARLVTHYPRGQRELLGPFTRFGPRETADWFRARGVALKTEDDGRMFPITDNSGTIVDCLVKAAAGAGVRVHTGTKVEAVERAPAGGGFRVRGPGVPDQHFDRVLVATGNGSRGYRIAASLGHTIVPCVPSLFTFKVVDGRLAGLAGVSFDDVQVSLDTGTGKSLVQRGPLLITHWGVSGPVVLALSAWGARLLQAAGYHAGLAVNFLPGKSAGEVRDVLRERRGKRGKTRVQGEPQFMLPRRYWVRVCEAAGVTEDSTWAHLTQESLEALAGEVSAAKFTVSGKGVFKDEFVTCGGVELKEVDFRTMESRRCPGLYLAGEVLDIDGVTGGFNFQSAWTCGYLAGASMSQALA